MSLVAIDVGNSNVVLGLFQGERLVRRSRFETDTGGPGGEIASRLRELLQGDRAPAQVAISNVAPSLQQRLNDACEEVFSQHPLVVTPALECGLTLEYENAAMLGSDRFVNAVSAFHRYGGPCIVVDFGTATKYEAISADGHYPGGAIAPGIKIAAEALFQRGARLSPVDLAFPPSPIGKNTIQSMQSGILFGALAQMEGMIARYRSILGPQAAVIATGGLASLVAPSSAMVNHLDPDLTLHGLRLAADYASMVAGPGMARRG